MGPLGELGALFNPGMRHEIEERQSKANRREEEGNARDGDLRIDLASGVAVINAPTSGPARAQQPAAKDRQPAEDQLPAAGTAGQSAEASAARTPATPAAQPPARTRTSGHGAHRAEPPRADESRSGAPRTDQRPASKASRAAR